MTRPPVLTREVVAAVLLHGDDVCLLRRSQAVGSDRGLWHCVTGYVEPAIAPLTQAITEIGEIGEETGLRTDELVLRGEEVLAIGDWTVHVLCFSAAHRRVQLNWENDACRWVDAHRPLAIPVVPWLPHVLQTALTPS